MSDTKFEARKRRHTFDGQQRRQQLTAQKHRAEYEFAVPSHVYAPASVTTVIDDFEDGDIAEYQYHTGDFAVQSTVVKEGLRALEVVSGIDVHISSFTGLNYYPKAGDTFRWWGRSSNLDRYLLLYFGAQEGTGALSDQPDGYAAYWDFSNNGLHIRLRQNGSNTRLASTNISWSPDTWYQCEVQWGTDGTITIRVLDASGTEIGSPITATDSAFTSGGITWQTSGHVGPKYIDYARKVA